MVYYKSVRYIDGRMTWVIEDDHGNINKSPTKDQLNVSILDDKKRTQFKGRKCCECGSYETYIYGSRPKWYTHICTKECCTGYICNKCYIRMRHKLPEDYHSIVKSMRKFRNKQLSKDSKLGKGFIGEMIVAKTRGLKSCSMETDVFNHKSDLSIDPEYGDIQVKLRTPQNGDYKVSFGAEHNFDTLFVLCMSKDMKNIEKMYAIPEGELYGITQITICKNGTKYETFRIDEVPYNDVFHNMKLESCPVLENG